jgi:diguanylate cyclase (GGDEF)-like protein
LGDDPSRPCLRSLGLAERRMPARWCDADADGSGDPPLPLNESTADVALLIVGMLLGALAFSFFVGRYRARQLAKLTDSLAEATALPATGRSLRVSDRVLSSSIERLQKRISEVESLATTDQLTHLLNRLACLNVLSTEIERANRYDRQLAVAIIDIDHFKRINDTHGHAVGDEVLAHVAGLLRANIRAVDALGRYGGEEFLLVMPETDIEGGLATAENIRRGVGRAAVKVPVSTGTIETTVTVSIGVAGRHGVESLDMDRILREADSAMYGAKASGRDQVHAHRPVNEDGDLARATIDADARTRAIEVGHAAFEASNLHLLDALRQRPGWAGGASQMIANLSADIGRAVGLSDGDIDRIRTASLLHDLGKLAIPDEILSKPAPLSAVEWRTIVEHPRIGQVVLEQAGAIRDAASIVLHHHEWFDGRGYPHGLAGSEIPVGSRIVAIADAYEAMISDRPYSPAISHQAALDELIRQRGSQFDPELVDVFVALVGDGRTETGRQYGAPAYMVQPLEGTEDVAVAGQPATRKPRSKRTAAAAGGRRRA